MAKHNETGAKGEQLAAEYLERNGYTLLHRNWRHHRIEVDLICAIDSEIIFVEVKTRTGLGFGFPEEAVSERKKKDLITAANAFIDANESYTSIRLDIISILLSGNTVSEILHLEDAIF